jgi:hypothetical protein
MKQVQSHTTLDQSVSQRKARTGVARIRRRQANNWQSAGARASGQSGTWSWMTVVLMLLDAIWFAICLPFRLVFWTVAWLGRLTGVIIGFLLMVVGMALWASPLFIVGIPLFVVGLVLTLRSLD